MAIIFPKILRSVAQKYGSDPKKSGIQNGAESSMCMQRLMGIGGRHLWDIISWRTAARDEKRDMRVFVTLDARREVRPFDKV